MRLFIAVDIPAELKACIAELQQPLKELKGVRCGSAERIHLTLKFLGEIKEEKLSSIVKRLENVEVKPFSIALDRAGVFPGQKKIRVVWVDVQPQEQLCSLKKAIDRALPEFKDDHAFKPHLTIARVRFLSFPEERDKLMLYLTEMDIKKTEFRVNSFKLYKSTLMPEGPVYELIKEFGA